MGILNLEIFLLVFTRIASFFVVTPLFSMRSIPAFLKIGFSFLLAIIVIIINPDLSIQTETALGYYFLIIKEAAGGLFMGYITNLIFQAIQMGGHFTDRQAGFSMAESYDPLSESKSAIYGRMYNWMALSLLLVINAHHYIIKGIIDSFQWAPIGAATIVNVDIADIIYIFAQSFLTAFQISIPIMIVIFMSDMIMGMIARTVPQLNVFILGMPLKVVVGLMAFLVLVLSISNMMIPIIEKMPLTMNKLIRLL